MPKSPGVYFFENASGKLLYIGKARSLVSRVGSYFQNRDLLPRTENLVEEIDKILYLPTETEVDALLLEANLIRKFQPPYNVQYKDNKSFPLVKITKESVPRVLIVRKEKADGSLYYGPFPTGSNISHLLRQLRKIFPFVSEIHRPEQICFRSHLGLCPCPIAGAADTKKYRKSLASLKKVLLGKRTGVIRQLEREMKKMSDDRNFEEAGRIKEKLNQLYFLGQTEHRPWEYELNPNLLSEIRRRQVNELCLAIPGLWDKENFRLECFDISHTGRKQTTASLVVFTNGQKDSQWYRKFKIKRNLSDDISSIKEAVSRRLKHMDWPLPDLLVVDGGAGQVAAAKEAITEQKIFVPIIGLAKRLETIYLSTGEAISLPRSNGGLKLLQMARDEAHRFARKYHFQLRSRNMLN